MRHPSPDERKSGTAPRSRALLVLAWTLIIVPSAFVLLPIVQTHLLSPQREFDRLVFLYAAPPTVDRATFRAALADAARTTGFVEGRSGNGDITNYSREGDDELYLAGYYDAADTAEVTLFRSPSDPKPYTDDVAALRHAFVPLGFTERPAPKQ